MGRRGGRKHGGGGGGDDEKEAADAKPLTSPRKEKESTSSKDVKSATSNGKKEKEKEPKNSKSDTKDSVKSEEKGSRASNANAGKKEKEAPSSTANTPPKKDTTSSSKKDNEKEKEKESKQQQQQSKSKGGKDSKQQQQQQQSKSSKETKEKDSGSGSKKDQQRRDSVDGGKKDGKQKSNDKQQQQQQQSKSSKGNQDKDKDGKKGGNSERSSRANSPSRRGGSSQGQSGGKGSSNSKKQSSQQDKRDHVWPHSAEWYRRGRRDDTPTPSDRSYDSRDDNSNLIREKKNELVKRWKAVRSHIVAQCKDGGSAHGSRQPWLNPKTNHFVKENLVVINLRQKNEDLECLTSDRIADSAGAPNLMVQLAKLAPGSTVHTAVAKPAAAADTATTPAASTTPPAATGGVNVSDFFNRGSATVATGKSGVTASAPSSSANEGFTVTSSDSKPVDEKKLSPAAQPWRPPTTTTQPAFPGNESALAGLRLASGHAVQVQQVGKPQADQGIAGRAEGIVGRAVNTSAPQPQAASVAAPPNQGMVSQSQPQSTIAPVTQTQVLPQSSTSQQYVLTGKVHGPGMEPTTAAPAATATDTAGSATEPSPPASREGGTSSSSSLSPVPQLAPLYSDNVWSVASGSGWGDMSQILKPSSKESSPSAGAGSTTTATAAAAGAAPTVAEAPATAGGFSVMGSDNASTPSKSAPVAPQPPSPLSSAGARPATPPAQPTLTAQEQAQVQASAQAQAQAQQYQLAYAQQAAAAGQQVQWGGAQQVYYVQQPAAQPQLYAYAQQPAAQYSPQGQTAGQPTAVYYTQPQQQATWGTQ